MSGSDASGATPVQTDGGDAPNATGLLSLPNELLAEIGRHVAPLGGRKAGALRLTCRRLGKAIEPVVWSSIAFSADIYALDPLLYFIQIESPRHATLVTSLRYHITSRRLDSPIVALKSLTNLKRLHVHGDVTRPQLGESIRLATSRMRRLKVLEFETLDLEGMVSMQDWTDARSVVVRDCKDPTDIFYDTRAPRSQERRDVINPPPLDALDFEAPSSTSPAHQSTLVLEAIKAVLDTAREINIRWSAADADAPKTYGDLAAWTVERDPPTAPLKLHIIGLKHLFNPFNLTSHTKSTHAVVRLLNWVAPSGLEWLTLPVERTFASHALFFTLSLPHLKTLSLARTFSPPGPSPSPDLLAEASYAGLISLLSSITTPLLTTLHLRGWLDLTGVATIDTLAQSAPHRREIALHLPFLFGLLHILLGTTITTLRLENTEGYTDGNVQYIVERDGERNWEGRLARFW